MDNIKLNKTDTKDLGLLWQMRKCMRNAIAELETVIYLNQYLTERRSYESSLKEEVNKLNSLELHMEEAMRVIKTKAKRDQENGVYGECPSNNERRKEWYEKYGHIPKPEYTVPFLTGDLSDFI